MEHVTLLIFYALIGLVGIRTVIASRLCTRALDEAAQFNNTRILALGKKLREEGYSEDAMLELLGPPLINYFSDFREYMAVVLDLTTWRWQDCIKRSARERMGI